MGKQLEIAVGEGEDARSLEWLDARLAALLLFWPRSDRGKRPRALPRKVDDGRWEVEIASDGQTGTVPGPIRAAGRTRVECLHAALVEGTAALRRWGMVQRQRAEIAAGLADEVERYIAANTRETDATTEGR